MNDSKMARTGVVRDLPCGKQRQLVPRDELAAAFEDAPVIDYDELRAELDVVADPSPKDWWAWAARTDRHIRRGALERE